MIVLATLYMLILHAPGGQEVTINAKRIASMREAEVGEKNRYLTDEVRCMINTEDGKFITVVETCAEVRRLIRALEQEEDQS